MKQNWPASLDFVWEFDGLRHDAAPGEAFTTSYGVTAMTWETARGRGIVNKPIQEATQEDCGLILHDFYWDRVDGDNLPSGTDLVIFNSAMIAGVRHAAPLAQRIVGADEDGIIGPLTVLAIRGMHPIPFIQAYTAADARFFAGLARAPLFLAGWDRRADAAAARALELVNR